MRVVVTGASGNVGTSLLPLLADDPTVTAVTGVARRRPSWHLPGVDWVTADVGVDVLDPIVRGADAVVHLAWLIQPSRDERVMWATNVVGTRRVADAAAGAGVPVVVAASSVGAYSPAPAGEIVDESWPTDGVPESTYSWQKSQLERTLDVLAERQPSCRVVRVRPALIFKHDSARHVRNLFVGRLLGARPVLGALPVEGALRLLGRSPIPFQVVHADDVAAAIHRALHADVRGAFNLASPGVIGRATSLAGPLTRFGRPLVGAAWRARVVPADPGWLSLADAAPLMSTDRARTELGWAATADADAVTAELLRGLRDDGTFPTPPLEERRLPPSERGRPSIRPG